MIRFSATINAKRAAFTPRFTLVLTDVIELEMVNAAIEFAIAALSVIPVRTGFLAGAYTNIFDLVKKFSQVGEIALGGQLGLLEGFEGQRGKKVLPTVTKKDRQTARIRKSLIRLKQREIERGAKPEYYYPGKILKTPLSGTQFATPTQDIITTRGTIVTFQWRVDISYYPIQDIHGGNSPTSPWGSLEKGKQAFLAYMRSNNLAARLNKLDKITLQKFLVNITIGVTKDGRITRTQERPSII